MKKMIIVLASTALCIGLVITVYANKNEDEAKKYCEAKKAKGIGCKVSKWRGCGTGWSMEKAFRGSGKDYYACTKTLPHIIYDGGTSEHKKKAEAECERLRKEGNTCTVVKGAGCGKGWEKAKSYGGFGKTYVVCVPAAKNACFNVTVLNKLSWNYLISVQVYKPNDWAQLIPGYASQKVLLKKGETKTVRACGKFIKEKKSYYVKINVFSESDKGPFKSPYRYLHYKNIQAPRDFNCVYEGALSCK